MTDRTRRALLGFAAAAALSVPLAARAAGPMAGVDTDDDGTISLDEAKAAASARYDALDTDRDDKLDAKELRGHLSKADFKEAETDGDATLSKGEYLALVEKRYSAADTDNDGKIDARELRTKAGRRLMSLLR